MEITMHENIRLTKQDTWNGSHLANAGRNEAISTSPLEHLEHVTLEQKVRDSSDPLANRNQNPQSTN